MLTNSQRAQVRVVLVRARNPQNIGAVARAMHDFGFPSLCVVNDFHPPLEGARAAVDASDVLAAAQAFSSVPEAVADCTLVVGTTAVGERAPTHPVHALPAAADLLHQHLASGSGNVALLFGSEKTGLSNDELSHCHWLLTIPMYEHPGLRHPSMNLGQAAAVALYELVRGMEPARSGASPTPPATAEETERLRSLLGETLAASGYSSHHPANSAPEDLRRLLLRLRLSTSDIPVWMGMLRQILWKLRSP